MASGDTLVVWTPQANEPPSSAFATFDLRNLHPVLDFDASASESAVFSGVMPQHYGSSGVDMQIHWTPTSATSGTVVWAVSWERIGDQQQDIDSDGFAAANLGTIVAPGTAGQVDIVTVAFTEGADMDSIVVGDGFRIKVMRDHDDAEDSMTGDAELRFLEAEET